MKDPLDPTMIADGTSEHFDEERYPLDAYAEVVPGLYQADTTWSPIQLFDQGFDAVFDLCGIDRGDGLAGQRYVVHPMDDVPWIPDQDAIHELAGEVAHLVRRDRRVVVNCMSGLNRSGLLVGRTLIALGHTPEEAVAMIREARGPRALSNRAFAKFLLLDCTPRALACRRRS